MKKAMSILLSVLLTAGVAAGMLTPAVQAEASTVTYYVDPSSKGGDGSADKPFKAIEEARDAIRSLDKTGEGGVNVILRNGEYKITSPITFTAEDSGTESFPISYIAENKLGAKLTGGFKLNYSDFKELSSAEKAKLNDTGAASKVQKLDLTKYGVDKSNVGALYYDPKPLIGLYIDGVGQTVARYPNEGYLNTAGESSDPTHVLIADGDSVSRMKTWDKLSQVGVFGFPRYEWATHASLITSFDEATGAVNFNLAAGYDGYVEGARYYFSNIYEELDTAGEYYIDTDTCTLYAYLPDGAKNAELTMSLYNDKLINVNGAEHITFKDVEFSMTRGRTGVEVKSNDVTFDGIKLYGIGGVGMNLDGYRITVKNSELTGTGEDCIRLYGGDRQTLTSSENLIYNNYFHHWATTGYTYRPAVRADGVGMTISHNEMAYTGHFAIHYYGNDHMIEYNDIHHVTLDSSDAGAIYAGRQWTYYGNVIRYNYIHDMGNPELGDANAIYFDDGLSGQTVYGNIIQNVYGPKSHALGHGGGRDNKIYNNIFIDIYNGTNVISDVLYVDTRSRAGAEDPTYWAGDTWEFAVQFSEVPVHSEIWKTKYPALAQVKYERGTFELDDPYAYFNSAYVKIKNNAMYVFGNGPKGMKADFSGLTYNRVPELNDTLDLTGNSMISNGMADFVDPENGDLTLKSDAAVFEKIPGFFSIPFSDIGRVEESDVEKMNFSDVKDGDWYFTAAEYTYKNGLMNGTSATTFSPMMKMSRAQLVTVLYRLDGQCMAHTEMPFDDLTQDWYRAAVAWAYENGIVNGTSATKFSPDGDLTREQTATILYRYCKYRGYDVTKTADVTTFPDHGNIGSYAVEAISWACAEGLLTGKPVGDKLHLDPLGTATRSEVATILMRFCEKY